MPKRDRGPDRVRQAMNEIGVMATVRELPESTRTSQEAAQAIGCKVAQIAKSLVFMTKRDERGCLVIASGSNRVDEAKLERLIGQPVQLADAKFVRQATGYAIGGVPPLELASSMPVYLDEDLMQFSRVWAAAGSPFAVVGLTPDQLQRVSGGMVVEVAE